MKIVRNDLFDYKDLIIYQGESEFKFSLDSILLAEFINIKPTTKNVLDICTGNAPIPLILSTKFNGRIIGVEVQKEIYNMAVKSVLENRKEDQITIYHNNIKDYKTFLEDNQYDIISCNPPYFKVKDSSLINCNKMKAIARHEVEVNMEEIVEIVSKLIKSHGSFYISHRCERFEEIYNLLKQHKFVIKKMQFIYSKKDSDAKIMLIEAVKDGNESMKVGKPIIINEYKSYQNIFEEEL